MIIIIIINLIYKAQFDTNGILTALYIVITYIQMQYVHVWTYMKQSYCSGVQCTHCSATKIFGNCYTSRPSLHSSRKQVSIFFFSMHVAMSQFFQVWRLERCKTVVLVDNKTFHNNWYLKQHECGLIWVWFTWIDLQIYPSCGASHSESTLPNVCHVRWRHIVLECRVFCFRSLFIHFFVDQLNGSHYF